MMQQYMKELEQDPYSFEDFVERLAWRTSDGFKEDGIHGFDPNLMHETFLQAIKDLQVLQERQHKKCEKLEDELKEEENKYSQEVSKLQDRNRESVTLFEDLDERINFIATKVIHVGDQLESVNVPRSRAVEAQKLMLYFTEFLSPGPVVSTVFTNKEELFEAADIIEKLHMISQELPSSKVHPKTFHYNNLEACPLARRLLTPGHPYQYILSNGLRLRLHTGFLLCFSRCQQHL